MREWQTDDTLLSYLRDKVKQSLMDKEILSLLNKDFPHYNWSQGVLRRRLSYFNVKRHDGVTPDKVITAVTEEIQSTGQDFGYRQMWRQLRLQHDILPTREQVHTVMQVVSPEGLQSRKPRGRPIGKRREFLSMGVNYLWSIDGYDKLRGFRKSQFPFGVYGIADVHSRRILSLKVSVSNNDPFVVASGFIEAIKENNVIPAVIRVDGGTEHSFIEDIQKVLRSSHTDSMSNRCVFKGPSTSNTVIEGLWGDVRRHGVNFFRRNFKELLCHTMYNPGVQSHRDIMYYVYEPIVQNQLDSFVEYWNSHRIRQQKCDRPKGVPNVLYITETQHGHAVDYNKLAVAESQLRNSPSISKEMFDWCTARIARDDINLCNAQAVCKLFLQEVAMLSTTDTN